MDLYFMPWEPDNDVYGEAAGMSCDGRVLDLVVTHGDETFSWEVVDDSRVDNRIAKGTAASADEARRAAETAGRRAFIRAA